MSLVQLIQTINKIGFPTFFRGKVVKDFQSANEEILMTVT